MAARRSKFCTICPSHGRGGEFAVALTAQVARMVDALGDVEPRVAKIHLALRDVFHQVGCDHVRRDERVAFDAARGHLIAQRFQRDHVHRRRVTDGEGKHELDAGLALDDQLGAIPGHGEGLAGGDEIELSGGV